MKRLLLLIPFSLCLLVSWSASPSRSEALSFLSGGNQVKIEFFTPEIVRVTKVPAGVAYTDPQIAVVRQPAKVKLKITSSGNKVTLASSALKVVADTLSGSITFATSSGEPLLVAGKTSFLPIVDAGKPSWQVSQPFSLKPDEEIYGFGLLQNLKMSQRGENRVLRTGNLDDGIPFFQSIKGYGVYFDNYSPVTVTDSGDTLTLQAEAGEAADFYFIYGGNPDGVVAGVRELTGDVPMAPLWTFGFMQSRERYKSQQEIVGVLERYRKDGVPIDCMIQDWQYWGPNYLWNAMDFLNENFSEPEKMIADIHGNNAKCMISIWQSFGPQTLQYRLLEEKGLLFDFPTWPTSGISHVWPPRMEYPSGVKVYDCYSPEARDIYWNHLRRLYDLGLDGWWMDSTEPDHFDEEKSHFDIITSKGVSYRNLVNAFPVHCVGGVYDHQRQVSDSTRVFILTRSATFGQQRYGANTWSGDVASNWDMLRKQIPAGLNFSLTGNPNFNSDLGGFFSGCYNGVWKGRPGYENPAFRELYLRWMQHGVFYPMMRSHGADTPRELYYYGKEGEPVYDAMVEAIKLRYVLLPYVYSTAWQVSKNRDTFMRALVMDFPDDARAREATDAYMFGRALLTVPVLHAGFTPESSEDSSSIDEVDFNSPVQHKVYLPARTGWYYFHDGKRYAGGAEVSLTLDLAEIPFFVREGSILPIGPEVQYTSEKPWNNLEIRIYPGADGEFTLYEDAGDSYAYELGEYTEIPMKWDDKKRRLLIGDRKGGYPGMIESRNFRLSLPDGSEKTVSYAGKKTVVSLP